MATKNAAPRVDLNGKGMADYGDQTPFIPFGESKLRVSLSKLLFHDGFKGQAYRAKVVIKDSDREDIKVGYEYVIQFKLDSAKDKQARAMKSLRSLVAACFGQDPGDESFDGNEALQTLCDLSEEDGLGKDDDSTFEFEIVSREKAGVDSKTKKPMLDENGVQKMFTNQFYNRV